MGNSTESSRKKSVETVGIVCLFIGGPWHGKRRRIEFGRHDIEVPETPFSTERIIPFIDAQHRHVINSYRYTMPRTGLMIGQDVTFDQAIAILIHGFDGGVWREPIESDDGTYCYLRQFPSSNTPILVRRIGRSWCYHDDKYGTWESITDKISRMERPPIV